MSSFIRSGSFFVLAALAAPLAACNPNKDTGRYGQLVDAVFARGYKVPRETVAAVPYATIGVEIGDTAQRVLVLGTARSGELDWYTPALMIATRGGRIVETAGFGSNLTRLVKLDPSSPTATSRNDAPEIGKTYNLSLDIQDLGLFGIAAECTTRDDGQETIEILGAQLATKKIGEHCYVADLVWSFDNEYWADVKTGFIWRSTQTVHPKLDPITIEVLRPAAEEQ